MARMIPIDTSALPVSTQLQLQQLGQVSSEMGQLEPSTSPTATTSADLGASLFTGSAYLDLSPAAQALIQGQSDTSTALASLNSDSAPGPGWQAGFDPTDAPGYDPTQDVANIMGSSGF